MHSIDCCINWISRRLNVRYFIASRSTCMFFIQLWEILVMVASEWGCFFNGRVYVPPPVLIALQWWLRWRGGACLSCIRKACLLCERKQRGGAGLSSGNGLKLNRPEIFPEEKHFWREGKTVNSCMSWRVKYVAALHQECAADLPRAGKHRWQGSGALLCPSVVCLHVQGCAACRGPAQRSSKGGLGEHPVSNRGRPAATRCFRLLPRCHSVNTGSLCGAVGGKRFTSVCGWCVRLGMLCGD